MRVQKLDRILDGDDVVVVRFVDQIDDRSERRTLATAGWPSDQHDPVFDIYYLFQLFRQIEIAEVRRSHRNHAHDDRVRAALLEDIHAKTSVAGNTERQVGRAGFFETLDCRLLIADDQLRNAGRVGRRKLFQTGNANRHEFACQFDLRRPARAEKIRSLTLSEARSISRRTAMKFSGGGAVGLSRLR